MPISKAQQRATAKYVKSNYDRIELKVSKGSKAVIVAAAATQNDSVNNYIKRAVSAQIKHDTGVITTL